MSELTKLELYAERVAARMGLAAMFILVYAGVLYVACYDKPFFLFGKVFACVFVGLGAAYVVYNALLYTDLRLAIFWERPMCPRVDMIPSREEEEAEEEGL